MRSPPRKPGFREWKRVPGVVQRAAYVEDLGRQLARATVTQRVVAEQEGAGHPRCSRTTDEHPPGQGASVVIEYLLPRPGANDG